MRGARDSHVGSLAAASSRQTRRLHHRMGTSAHGAACHLRSHRSPRPSSCGPRGGHAASSPGPPPHLRAGQHSRLPRPPTAAAASTTSASSVSQMVRHLRRFSSLAALRGYPCLCGAPGHRSGVACLHRTQHALTAHGGSSAVISPQSGLLCITGGCNHWSGHTAAPASQQLHRPPCMQESHAAINGCTRCDHARPPSRRLMNRVAGPGPRTPLAATVAGCVNALMHTAM